MNLAFPENVKKLIFMHLTLTGHMKTAAQNLIHLIFRQILQRHLFAPSPFRPITISFIRPIAKSPRLTFSFPD
jgi:hypothetical protein